MTSQAIDNISAVISDVQDLQRNAVNVVERVDLADIESDLRNVMEKLNTLRSYQEAKDTDYDELWSVRKEELKAFAASRDAWIRTEIFTHLLFAD